MRKLSFLSLCLTAGLLAGTSHAQPGFFQPKTKIQLLLDFDSAQAGSTVMAGLKMEMPDRWHTYWRAPGEVGKATEIHWKLPAGITAGEIQWPVPKRMVSWDLISFEYSHEVVLLIPLTIAKNAKAGIHTLTAEVTWLECETEGSCVPGKGSVTAELVVGQEAKSSTHTDLLAKWKAKLPTPSPELKTTARWEGPAVKNKRPLLIELQTSSTNVDFWGYHQGNDWQMHPKPEIVESDSEKVVIRKRIDLLEGAWPSEFRGMFVVRADGKTSVLEKTVKLEAPATAKPSTPATLPGAAKVELANPFVTANPFAPKPAGPAAEAKLVLNVEQAEAGATILAAAHFTIQENWHLYWKNPGTQFGLPIEIKWKLPEGFEAGPTKWAVPQRKEYRDYRGLGDFNSYEYSGEVALITPISIPADASGGELSLKANLKWAECETDGNCVPQEKTVNAPLTIGGDSKSSIDAGRFAEWQAKLPKPRPGGISASARWESEAVDGKRYALIEVSSDSPDIDFFPHKHESLDVAAISEISAGDGGNVVIRKQVSGEDGNWNATLTGLLVQNPGSKTPTAHALSVAIGDGAPATGTSVASAPAPSGEQRSLLYYLLLAFIGGIILNIMPCVLPVISLKILGFVNQAEESPGRVRMLGVVYSIGVLCSFLVLAGLIIGVQKAGGNAVWGMQFSNPMFVICLTALITLVALNLFGVFEITLSSGTMTAANSLAAKHGVSGAFFNGVLTTLLATPCSAPFLIGALSFALVQPPPIIILTFLVSGAGLAFPYLLLSMNSKWLRFLPKPGNWMVHFKVAMGFPMLATAIWLLSIGARRFGLDGVLWIGFFLVMLSLAAWIWGTFVQRGTKRIGLAMTLSLASALCGYYVGLERSLHWRTPPAIQAKVESGSAEGKSLLVNPRKKGPDGIEWYAWSHAAIAEAQSKGRPVLVDFTAEWCVTCKGNKATSLEIDSTRAKLKDHNYISLIADFTDFPPDIAQELIRFKRPAVPLVVVYSADPGKEPIILPTLLTPGIVHEALERAANSDS